MIYNWRTKVQYVRGIGPTKAKELNGMGIKTVGDLLEYKPLHYIYPGIMAVKDLKEGYAIIKAKIVSIERLPRRVPTVEAVLDDGTGTCKAVWWNQIFVLQHLRPGMTVTFWGKCKAGVFNQPKFSTYGFNPDEVVGGDYGVHTKTMRAVLGEVLDNCDLPDLSDEVSMFEVFHNLHFPKNKHEHNETLKVLKFNELLLMQLAMLKRRQQAQSGGAEVIEI